MQKALWLRCSSVTERLRLCSFVAPRHRAFCTKTAPLIIFRQSLTAEKIFNGVDGIQARLAGTEPNARIKVTAGHLSWATIIFVMEKKHLRRPQTKFPQEIAEKKVICLHIADDYDFMQPELVDILEAGVRPHLKGVLPKSAESKIQHPPRSRSRPPPRFIGYFEEGDENEFRTHDSD